ncbi:MAG: hypothetical protein Q8O74_07780, partial [bacterium]|nr:hypothetical protein [bacterium]
VDYIKQDKLLREVQPLKTKKSLKDCLNNKTTDNSDEYTRYIDNAVQHYVRNSDKYNKNDTLGIHYNIDTMLAGKNDTAFACTIIYITNDTLYQVNNFNSKWIFEHLDSYRKKFKKHLDL